MTTARRAIGTVPSSSRTSDVVVYVLSRSDATAHGATWAAGPWGGAAFAHGGGGGCWGRTVASGPAAHPDTRCARSFEHPAKRSAHIPHISFAVGQYARQMRIFVAGGTGAIGRPALPAPLSPSNE